VYATLCYPRSHFAFNVPVRKTLFDRQLPHTQTAAIAVSTVSKQQQTKKERKMTMIMDEDQIEAAEGQGGEGIPKLMKGLQSALDENDAESAEAILDACLRMSSSGSEVCDQLGEYLGTTLANALTVMMEEAVVIEVLLAVLVKVIKTPAHQASFGTPANIQQLMKAMTTHSEGEETLIEYACLVIEKLAQDNEAVANLLKENGVEAQLTAAESIITNVRNKKYVGQARSALKLSPS